MFRSLSLATFALGSFVNSAVADITEDFETLKTSYEMERSRLVAPFERLYLSRLHRLESLYIDQQLYEEAMRCREERLKLEASHQSTSSDELIFTSSEASLRGGVKLTGEWTDGWTQGGAMGWKLPGLDKGGYEVFLVYSGASAPVEVKLQESSFHVRGVLPRAGGETRQSLGYLKITDKNAPLELSLVPPINSTPLRVKALVLVPQWP